MVEIAGEAAEVAEREDVEGAEELWVVAGENSAPYEVVEEGEEVEAEGDDGDDDDGQLHDGGGDGVDDDDDVDADGRQGRRQERFLCCLREDGCGRLSAP